VASYVDGGFLPQAVFNYLCLLGWTPKGDQEKLSAAEMVTLFDPAHIHSSNARFDLKKCAWFNAQYLRELAPEALFAAAHPFLQKAGLQTPDGAMAARAVFSVKEKVSLLTELPEWVHYFFRADYPMEAEVDAKLRAKAENKALLAAVAAEVAQCQTWSEAGAQAAVDAAAAAQGVKSGALMPLLRFALTGQARGPGVTTIMDLLGKDRTAERLANVVATL
jgi:glutamyl-tRNA synthetase